MSDYALQILAFICAYRRRTGMSPSFRDIGYAIDVYPNTVRQALQSLRAAGLVTYEDRKARTLVPAYDFIPAGKLVKR